MSWEIQEACEELECEDCFKEMDIGAFILTDEIAGEPPRCLYCGLDSILNEGESLQAELDELGESIREVEEKIKLVEKYSKSGRN